MHSVGKIIGPLIKDHLVAHFGKQDAIDDELVRDGALDVTRPQRGWKRVRWISLVVCYVVAVVG